MSRERRRFRRWQIDVPVRELAPEHHVMRATSISMGGLFCPDATPRPEGSEVTLEIGLPDAKFTVGARVVHVGKWEGFGLGLEFTQPVQSLAAYLEQLEPPAESVD